jgi:ankyrin repeat protein
VASGLCSRSSDCYNQACSIFLVVRETDSEIGHKGKFSAEEYICLQSLWPDGIDYESQKNQNPKRVFDTCLWTLENPKYLEWRDNGEQTLLWISADPGCGKSVLARCIVDEDLPRVFPNDSSKRVLYYFFKDTSLEQRSVSRAISMILHQLFMSHPRLIQYALPKYKEKGAALFTIFSELWSIFTAAATDPTAGNIICVLDALDECNDQEQPRLLERLEDFCLGPRTSSSASRLKFLVTSRPYFEIRRRFDRVLEASNNIELAGNNESTSIKKEIDLVIKHQVANLKRENRLAPKVSEHLEKRLLETEHRTYLWLHLLWNIVRKNLSGTNFEMDRLIDNLPDDIKGSYEVLLQKCPDPVFARKVLQIVLVAARPLTLTEIDVALNVNEQTSSYATLEQEGPSRLQETLPSRCGLMISIIQSKVYFIHQTVKEFLLGKLDIEHPAGRVWQQSLELEESHHLLAKICLRSISFSEVELHRASLWNALLPEDAREMEPSTYCRSHTFLSYSAVYWADHFRDQGSNKGIQNIEYVLKKSNYHQVIGRQRRDYGTVLHAASFGGHNFIVQMLLKKGADVNAQGGWFGNALQAASERGHDQVVQMLLEKGANVNAQSGWFGNALHAASYGGHDQVVQMLLEKGVNVNAQGGFYGNALQATSERGHNQVVQMLLEKGANVNAQGGHYGNALQAASYGGHDQVVQMLFEKGANVNAQGGDYGNALQAASYGGHDQVVQMLLEKGADVNAQGGQYGNALQAASKGGHDQVVQVLLEKGANVNAQGGHYGNALQAASYGGHDQVVQMLLEKGADVNAQDGYYGNALQAASARGHNQVVQMLLEKGAKQAKLGGVAEDSLSDHI